MYFSAPAHPGEVLKFTSKVILTGRSSLMAHIAVTKMNDDKSLVDGFVTYIHVDEDTRPLPHNIEIVPETEEDIRLYREAVRVKNQRVKTSK
jgi:acyl-CoA hydrolase